MSDKREQVREEILQIPNNNILLELPTSFGKTKIALDLLSNKTKKDSKILIVVPRLVLIDTWKDEMKKWKYWNKFKDKVTFVTYVSLPKMVGEWDIVIYDEAHHLSLRCQNALNDFIIHNNILLSATVGREKRFTYELLFNDLYVYHVTVKEATEEKVLPDPRVYLIPLLLDNSTNNCEIIKNPTQKVDMIVPYKDRWKYSNVKNKRIRIQCTQLQYYTNLSSLITYYKNRTYSQRYKNLYLHKCGERLKWLSNIKTTYIAKLLTFLDKERTLTFCNSIAQTEILGTYCINSKNKQSEKNLNDFNEGWINHITVCDMLNEGINLVNCRVGIYAVLNSSERIKKQKLGRLLRHKDPIILIPYYRNTREEELVHKMCDFNPKLIKVITDLKEIKL